MSETATKYNITEEQFIQAMKDAVAEKGEDYVYPPALADESCMYLEYDEEDLKIPTGPSCIVGHALHRCGVPLAEMRRHEFRNAFAILPELTNLSNRVVDAAQAAQLKQDGNGTWGEALQVLLEDLESP